MRIRILVAEALPIERAGLVGILQHDPLVTVVGEAQDPDEAAEMYHSLRPDLVLLGVHLVRASGSTIIKIVERFPDTDVGRVLMLSADRDPHLARTARHAGVGGYLPATITPRELLAAVRKVMRGERVLPDPGGVPGSAARPHLTTREIVILEAVATGSTTKEIALRLGCSPRTVETYVQRIFDKLGARSRAQAVSIACQEQLLRI